MPPDPLEPCEPEEEEETTPATVKLHLARQEFGTPKVRAELSSLLDLEAKTTTIKHQLAIADAVHVRKIDDALETLEMQRLLRLEKGGVTTRSIEISEAEHERKKRAIKLVSEEDERRALEKAHAHRLHMQTLTQFEANHRAELAYKGSSLGRKGERERFDLEKAMFEFELLVAKARRDSMDRKAADEALEEEREQKLRDAEELARVKIERCARLHILLEGPRGQALASRWPRGTVTEEDLESFEEKLRVLEAFSIIGASDLYCSSAVGQTPWSAWSGCWSACGFLLRRPRTCQARGNYCCCTILCLDAVASAAVGAPLPLVYTASAMAAVGAYAALLWSEWDITEPPVAIGDTGNLASIARPVHTQEASRIIGDRHALMTGELVTNVPFYPAIAREMRNDRPGGTLTRSTAAHMYSHFMHKHKDSVLFKHGTGDEPLLVNDLIVNSSRVASQEAAIALRLMEDASAPPPTPPPWTIA